jgi:hypothetical protein
MASAIIFYDSPDSPEIIYMESGPLFLLGTTTFDLIGWWCFMGCMNWHTDYLQSL